MTAIRIEDKTILDFSNQKVNKHRVTQALKRVTLLVSDEDASPQLCLCRGNDIIIGMYTLKLYTVAPMKSLTARKGKTFGFSIYENTRRGSYHLDLQKHNLFKNQYWSTFDVVGNGSDNLSPGITTNDLVNIIMHCSRLNSLRAFS